MTEEEKQKAINALKKSAPVMAVTPKEYEDYIKTINKIIDWLEQPDKPESKSKEPELKPCPFCGTEVKMLKTPIRGYSGCFNFEVRCPKCGCSVDYIDSDTIYRTEEEAIANVIESWNERYVNWFERAKESEETK
jgi:Lar family restriction alleviation protein